MSGPSGSKRRLLVFFAVAGLLSALLVMYTIRQRRPPIPADADHAVSTQEECLVCHGPGRKNARGPNHPLNDQCFNCHERA